MPRTSLLMPSVTLQSKREQSWGGAHKPSPTWKDSSPALEQRPRKPTACRGHSAWPDTHTHPAKEPWDRLAHMVEEARLVSSCFSFPSRASPRFSRLLLSCGVSV